MATAKPADLARIVSAFANIPHCRLLGMHLEEVRRGSGMMSIDWDERLIGNPRTRVVHSGVVTALLDTLCGLVVMASVPEGTPLATAADADRNNAVVLRDVVLGDGREAAG